MTGHAGRNGDGSTDRFLAQPPDRSDTSPAAIDADELGKRYGRRWALRHCSLSVPAGRVVGLVGANGAGKTTFLHLAVGLLEPSEGSVLTLDGRPGAGTDQLARVGFVAQEAPVYPSLTVSEHLRLGERLNPRWDNDLVSSRIARLGLDKAQRAGRLSGGQRAQLALTLAMGKRPELLVLDEPVSSLDPLARREFLQDLMALVADQGPTVVLTSHLLADVERVCDHLIVVAGGRVKLAGDIDDLLATHKLLTGPRCEATSMPRSYHVVQASHTERQTTVLVRTTDAVMDPRWAVSDVGLEELVLEYMSASRGPGPTPDLVAVQS
ncbi:MAG TPA: ABC transporter ATP-binding protein [Acidimicrobiales bacterium]|nr:ABC transporter ATP-binding protein [Acidimicrobiales bacterium]